MCEWGTTRDVFVKVSADMSATGQDEWKWKPIDSCITDIVDALQRGGIDMRGSCCGHGKDVGYIDLQDGRTLLVVDGWQWRNQRGRYYFRLLWDWLKWLGHCRNIRGRIRYWIWKYRH